MNNDNKRDSYQYKIKFLSEIESVSEEHLLRDPANGHTSGPWELERVNGQNSTILGGPVATIGGDLLGERIEFCVGKTSDTGEHGNKMTEANARLIAAAPALEVVWSMVPDDVKTRIFEELASKRNAIWVKESLERIDQAPK